MNSPKKARDMFKKSCIALAVGLCFVGGAAYGQSADGSLSGQAKPSAVVTITSPETGVSRQLTADKDGAFTFSKLPPGKYKVSAAGVSRDVTVVVGTGSRVSLEVGQLDKVEVVGSRAANLIDVSSVESTTVFTQEQIQALPVARNVNAVALLAPGVVRGDAGLGAGSIPSFGGASVAENGYYINGFDVTNIRNFLSYADLPFEAIAQQQIKTGGYGAEYGRSLGGVISLVTKRGTNDWKGGGSLYWAPEKLRSAGKNVADLEPTQSGNFRIFAKDDKTESLNYNVYAGGPIIKDQLFVFGLVEGKRDVGTNYGSSLGVKSTSDRPNGMLKLDFQPVSSHLLELTAIDNRNKTKIQDYTNTTRYQTTLTGNPTSSAQESGGSVLIGKWTGYLTDNFTVSALAGQVQDKVLKTTGARVADLSCPVVLETNLAEIGCWIKPFPGPTVRDPNAPDDSDGRKAARLDAEYLWGPHTIRAGYDGQKFTSDSAGGGYSGGFYYRYFVTPASGTINGVANAAPAGSQYVRRRLLSSTSGSFEVDNAAIYLEDTWQINKNWLVYAGFRTESFDNKNGDGVSFVKADNLPAPRLGFSWNSGEATPTKIYGTAGRYFIPVASNTNIRATRGELFEQRFFRFSGRDPITQGPLNLSAEIGRPQIVSDGTLPNPATIADTKLRPMSQDEFILGFQRPWGKGWVVGAKATSRKIRNGFDDYCDTHHALEVWAADNKFNNFDSGTAAGCILMNPGRDVNLQVDVNNDGKLQEVTIPARYFGVAPYKRTYQALELSFSRPWDGKWSLDGSYTWSRSRGTAEGYVSSIINQEDAGITQDFDFASLTDGADGFLPNDRTHQIKVYGNYQIADGFRLGFNGSATSGRPLSCIGFVPTTARDYATAVNYTTASSYYCLNNAGTSVLTQRGSQGRTPWTYGLDLQVAYAPKVPTGKLTLLLDVLNVLNSQKAVEFDEVRDFSRQTSNAATGNQLSLNYGQPAGFQTPRYVRLTARYEF